MSKIRIKNFGPIKEGCLQDDGWLDISKVTVFIGNQGSGKSTMAKLISTLSWIEKAMVKGVLRQDELNVYNRFLKQLAYQRLTNYIQHDTVIQYQGNAFSFSFSAGVFEAHKAVQDEYLLPKIMYVPAERNFLSVVDRPDKLRNLPSPLYTFMEEYDNARNVFAQGITLPIGNVKFEYDKLNKMAHVVGHGDVYKLRLSEASSGFQSTVPLYLVGKYLSDWLVNSDDDTSVKETSIEEQRKLDKEIKSIMEDKQLTPEVRQSYLRQLSSKRKPACFINVVEEPEQNLFPISQWQMLQALLEFNNTSIGNKLIITTHSPYIINYLNIAVEGRNLSDKINLSKNKAGLSQRLNAIISANATISASYLSVYEMDEATGTIKKLIGEEGLVPDKNYLNNLLAEGNRMFDSLLEIEEDL